MLQISTGKFFTGEAYETLRRGHYYTNYQMFHEDERIETEVGSLQSVAGVHGLGALTCEIIERIQKQPGGPYPGEVVATAGDTLINDFAAIVSFSLNVTCTTDSDLARRLTANERPSLGADLVPQKHIARMFDRTVGWNANDAGLLKQFVSDLVALDRKSYEGAMRAIRRYVTGAHRISDDMNLAYALFVMSMESLAQTFDGFVPVWADYDQQKRRRIDNALKRADEEIATCVRDAILAGEHMALATRFRAYVLANVRPSFFREEADHAVGAISRPDLAAALREAYAIRSGYVHHLAEIPRQITAIGGFHETITVEGQETLTFAGLARLGRHVITNFIAQAPRTKTEKYDWYKDLPGKVTMQWAPHYWVGNPKSFKAETAKQYLEAFVGQVVERRLNPSATLTDIRPVLEKVAELVPGLAKPAQRLPMLALDFLFNSFVPETQRSAGYPGLLDTFKSDFEPPSVVSLAAHLLTDQIPDWALKAMEDLHTKYFKERHHANTLNLGRLLEAAFTLTLAEQNRLAGDVARAGDLVSIAVEAFPKHAQLRSLEASFSEEQTVAIRWQAVLLPPPAQADAPPDHSAPR